MESIYSLVIGLLMTALSLLGYVAEHPELPQASRDQAQQVAQQAIKEANQILQSKDTDNDDIYKDTSKSASIEVDVDGDTVLNVSYKNLPLSKLVLVDIKFKEEYDIDDNVQGSDFAKIKERNKLAGNYYLKAIPHENGLKTIKSDTFYLGNKSSDFEFPVKRPMPTIKK